MNEQEVVIEPRRGVIFYERANPLVPLMVSSNDGTTIHCAAPKKEGSRVYCTILEWEAKVKKDKIRILHDPSKDTFT